MQENKMEKKENPAQDVQDFQPMSEDRAYLCKTVHNLVMAMVEVSAALCGVLAPHDDAVEGR